MFALSNYSNECIIWKERWEKQRISSVCDRIFLEIGWWVGSQHLGCPGAVYVLWCSAHRHWVRILLLNSQSYTFELSICTDEKIPASGTQGAEILPIISTFTQNKQTCMNYKKAFANPSRSLMICRNDLANTLEASPWFSQQSQGRNKREN